ncbi:MAG: 3-phosphoglycerate dehydrogenase, partial [Erysipelotrichaceae bacterium]|nr:3-phosphoglycerate dehydrogenase [Erysipelotrichaceae bacterium]
MMNIKLYNKISSKGLNLFDDKYHVDVDIDKPNAILVRSAKLHDIELNDELKAIARAGAGVNNIPIDKCSEKGIVVFNTPGANANAVKELVLAGMLLSSRPIYNAMQWLNTVKDDENIADLAEKEKSKFTGCELQGKSLGVIGLGAIGLNVANMALHLGMDVYGYDPYLSIESAWQLSRRVKLVKSIEEIYKHSDYITIHVPMNDSTKNMIDKNAIKLMKNGVIVLNYARGGLVNEDDMIDALETNKVHKYVSDFASSKMMNQKDFICTPHLGASTPEAEENCAVMAVHQLMDYLENGNIKN